MDPVNNSASNPITTAGPGVATASDIEFVSEPGTAIIDTDVMEKLRECFDPEIPVNIVDLGLVYRVSMGDRRIDLKMTLTALGCPMAAEVVEDVRSHLCEVPGVDSATVEIVYDPMWTPDRMSEDARWELGMI